MTPIIHVVDDDDKQGVGKTGRDRQQQHGLQIAGAGAFDEVKDDHCQTASAVARASGGTMVPTSSVMQRSAQFQ